MRKNQQPDPTVKELLIMMKQMITNYETKLQDIQNELKEPKKANGKDTYDKNKDEEELKPINVKDIKLPDEYDGNAGAFME